MFLSTAAGSPGRKARGLLIELATGAPLSDELWRLDVDKDGEGVADDLETASWS